MKVTKHCLSRTDVKQLRLESVLYTGLFEHGYLEVLFARGKKIEPVLAIGFANSPAAARNLPRPLIPWYPVCGNNLRTSGSGLERTPGQEKDRIFRSKTARDVYSR